MPPAPSRKSTTSISTKKSIGKLDTDGPGHPEYVYGDPKCGNSTVVVAIRVRPAKSDICVKCLKQPKGGQVQIQQEKTQAAKYAFDYVFPPEADNFDIWAHIVKPCVNKLLKGINCAVFAYGGTGSGKSFTMGFENGGPEGQLHFATRHLFAKLEEAKVELAVYISYMEVYGCKPGGGNDNAAVTDLFSKEKKTISGFNQARILSQLTHVRIKSPDEMFKFFDEANSKRHVGAQGFNAKSSRSHGIAQICLAPKDFLKGSDGNISARACPKQPLPWAKMSIIDLAGSEPANLWYSKEDKSLMHRYNEAVVINMGLGALKACMASMAGKAGASLNKNNSMLTKILGDLLSKKTQGYLRVICTINPISQGGHVAALSKGTLDYAKEIKSIELDPGVERDLIAMQKMLDGGPPPGVVTVEDHSSAVCPHLHEVSPEMATNRSKPKGKARTGQHVYDCGAHYEGEFMGHIRHGKGVMTWPDGASYKGDWQDDIPNGKGIFSHPNGDVYEGDIRAAQADGKGSYSHSNGSVYNGGWKSDKKHGEGLEVWAGGVKYKGGYKDGMKNGNGLYDFGNGNQYKGTFLNDQMHGTGRFKWSDGREYRGDWKDNHMAGQGKFIFPDGKVYEGGYKDDQRHGQGLLVDPENNTKYKGGWKNGKQHGKGMMLLASGAKQKGVWDDGIRLS